MPFQVKPISKTTDAEKNDPLSSAPGFQSDVISSAPDTVKTVTEAPKFSRPDLKKSGPVQPDSKKLDPLKSTPEKINSDNSDSKASEKSKSVTSDSENSDSDKTDSYRSETSDSGSSDSEKTSADVSSAEIDIQEKNDAIIEDMNTLITKHALGSIGVGLIPVPIVDFVALTGMQLNLIKKLANAYDIPFSKDKVKNIIGALVGGGIPLPVGHALASIGKSVPVIGTIAGILAMPMTAGASTYAIGKVFLQHFACGGTLLDMDPDKLKTYYYEMFEEGKKLSISQHEEKKS
jgi:uncharacterized protein (DUF697 family)